MAWIAPIIKDVQKKSVMQRIVHNNHGEPAEVLRLEPFSDAPPLASATALVRVAAAPVHPGDLLGVSASPVFGAAPVIPRRGQVPGVEGVGVVEALAADVAPSHRIQVGTRAAFFPINGSWSSRIAAPLQSLIPVSNEVSDEVAAQMVVNTLTARLAMRAGHNALPEDKREDVTVIQTAANFAVGKRLCVPQIDEPPLRARGKDIEVLAMYMLERFRKDANRRLHGFTPDAIAALHSYRWPGNVRELINRVRRAIVMAGGRRITALD